MEFVKQQMLEHINKMNDTNIQETKQQLEKLFEFIELSQTIWRTVPNFMLSNDEEANISTQDDENIQEASVTTEEVVSMKELLEEADEVEDETQLNEPLMLERRLKGGVLKKSDNTTLYVPEKIIRANSWVHGDYILATGDNEQNLAFEKTADSTIAERSNRMEFDYCLVSKNEEGKLLIKEQYLDGVLTPTIFNGGEYEFIVETTNAANFRLQVGDLVTIAFYMHKPHEFKVIWLYSDTQELTTKTITAPKPSSFYKESNNEKKPKWNEAEKELLREKKIVIVGADFRSNDFIDLLKEAEISSRILSGDESEARFEAAVRGKDLIISLSSHTSHRSSELAKALAKKYAIPFRAAPTSISSVKRAIVHGISVNNVLFHSLF